MKKIVFSAVFVLFAFWAFSQSSSGAGSGQPPANNVSTTAKDNSPIPHARKVVIDGGQAGWAENCQYLSQGAVTCLVCDDEAMTKNCRTLTCFKGTNECITDFKTGKKPLDLKPAGKSKQKAPNKTNSRSN